MNDLIKRSLATAEIPSRLEPTSLSRIDQMVSVQMECR